MNLIPAYGAASPVEPWLLRQGRMLCQGTQGSTQSKDLSSPGLLIQATKKKMTFMISRKLGQGGLLLDSGHSLSIFSVPGDSSKWITQHSWPDRGMATRGSDPTGTKQATSSSRQPRPAEVLAESEGHPERVIKEEDAENLCGPRTNCGRSPQLSLSALLVRV